MILKFQTVKGAAGDVRVLGYISSGGDQPLPLFTNMAGGTVQELVREVAALRSLRPKLNKAGAHLIISHAPDQRALSESEWRDALDLALAEHRAEGAPYAAYLHTEKEHIHLHVYLLRIRSDGSVVKDSNSWRANERAARAIEARFGLDPPKPRAPEDRWPRASGAKAERGRRRSERLHASQTQIQPPQKGPLKVIDPHTIKSTIDESKSLRDLSDRLLRKGIEAKFVRAPGAAEPTGWLLRQVGPTGTWIKGSDVDRSLSLKKVRERLEEPIQRNRTRRQLYKSGISLYAALGVLTIDVAIHLVVGFINLIARSLARRAEVPEDTLGRFDVAEDGSALFVEPVDLPDDAPADQHARLQAARTVMAEAMDRTAEAIGQDNTSLLPSTNDPEVIQERERVIEQLDQIKPEDEDGESNFERERP